VAHDPKGGHAGRLRCLVGLAVRIAHDELAAGDCDQIESQLGAGQGGPWKSQNHDCENEASGRRYSDLP
jgi:hypothetical protein